MKMRNLGFILFAAFILASCKKEGDSGCISITTALPTVSASDNAAIQTLLKNNNLSGDNEVFFSFYSNPGNAQQQPTASAAAIQVRNGLPIFYSTLSYAFLNGVSEGVTGKVYGAVTLNSHSTQNLAALRQDFINEAINKQGIDPSFRDSCYVAQFGYFNANLFGSNDTTTNMVKAWNIHPKNSQFPACFINDDNGSTVYFDDGIRFLVPEAKK